MRRFDKDKNMQRANQLAEQRYLELKGLIRENLDEVAGDNMSMIISKIAKDIYSVAKKQGYNPSLSYNKGHGGMAGQIMKGDKSTDNDGDEKPSLEIRPIMNGNRIVLTAQSGVHWIKKDAKSNQKREHIMKHFQNKLFPLIYNYIKGKVEELGIELNQKLEGNVGSLIFGEE